MKRNVIKALVLLFVLLAIFIVSGCEREQEDSDYIEKQLLYLSADIEIDLPESGPTFVCKEAGQESKANLRGTGTYRSDGTPVTIELAGYYRNVDTGHRFIYDFDEQGRPVRYQYLEINGQFHHITTYIYDEVGRYISAELGSGKSNVSSRMEHKYDDEGNLTEYLLYDSNNNIVEKSCYEYDGDGNCVKEANTYYNYLDGELIGQNSSEYEYGYDKRGNQIQIKYRCEEGQTGLTTNTYDKKGNLLSTKSFSGNVSHYEYNLRGILIREENVFRSGTKEIVEYDRKGNKRKETTYFHDEIKCVIEYEKDGYKKRSFTKFKDGAIGIWETIHDKFGNCLTSLYFEDDSIVKSYKFKYDGDGYRMSQTLADASGNIIDVEYYDSHERTVRKDIYDGGVMIGYECYLYDEPEYTGDVDFPLRSSKLRTEYFDANSALIKYTENGKTYDAQGNEIE